MYNYSGAAGALAKVVDRGLITKKFAKNNDLQYNDEINLADKVIKPLKNATIELQGTPKLAE